MRIVGRALELSRSGRVKIRLHCPLAETLGCRGTVRLEVAASSARRRTVRLGSARFRVGGGQTRAVGVRVSRRGGALVRRARRQRARVVVSASDAARNRARAVARVTLRSRR
jgi:hypothetical protein